MARFDRPSRSAGRLSGPVVAATTLAAVLAGACFDGLQNRSSRLARQEAAIAVMAAMALEMMVAPIAIRPEAGSMVVPSAPPAAPCVRTDRPVPATDGLLLAHLDLPPPTA